MSSHPGPSTEEHASGTGANGPTCVCHQIAARLPHATRAALLVAAALALAAGYNALNSRGIRWGLSPDGRVGLPRAFESRLPEVSAAEALDLWRGHKAIFVDSRDEKDYRADHIPGAISIPMRRWNEVWPQRRSRVPKDAALVLYCYGFHCGLSTRMGKRLLELGYERPLVLRRGWLEWTEAGYPTVRHPRGQGG